MTRLSVVFRREREENTRANHHLCAKIDEERHRCTDGKRRYLFSQSYISKRVSNRGTTKKHLTIPGNEYRYLTVNKRKLRDATDRRHLREKDFRGELPVSTPAL